jgi:murein DD-endopeptidase MepM/ murein hydrolase activator NlpD
MCPKLRFDSLFLKSSQIVVFLCVMMLSGIISCASSQVIQSQEYRVKVAPGDTLAVIAQRYDTTWDRIARDNGIRDHRKIKVGEILIVRPGPGGYVAEGSGGDKAGFLSRSKGSALSGKSGGKGIFTIDEPNTPLEKIRGDAQPRTNPSAIARNDETKEERKGLLFGGESKWDWPVQGPVSSFYGPRRGKFHHGIDIRSDRGTLVRAVAAGRVVEAGWVVGYGRTIIVDHGEYKTLYGHCDTLRAREGSEVDAGEVVATVGDSGNAEGYHLHFEYRNHKDKPEDPMPRLRNQPVLTSSN